MTYGATILGRPLFTPMLNH